MLRIDAIRSKARHAAWKQDGNNYNPFSRTLSRGSKHNHGDEEHDLGMAQQNHSGTCVTDQAELTADQQRQQEKATGPRHAATFATTSSPTTTSSTAEAALTNNRETDLEKEQYQPQTERNVNGNSSMTNGESHGPVKRRHNKLMPWKKSEPDNEIERTTTRESKKSKKKQHFTIGGQLRALFFSSWINILLLTVPVGFALNYSHQKGAAIFVVNFIAIIPLAGMLSYATEEIALRTGEVLGGLLNASFGNAVELIVSIQALVQGKIVIVKTSLIGSMLSNLLLVMGMSFFLGGINRVEQFFNVTVAQTAASLLALSIGSLIVPTVFRDWTPATETMTDGQLEDRVEALSRGTSIILLTVYACYLFFQLKSHRDMYNEPSQKVEKRKSTKVKEGDAINSIVSGGQHFAASAGGSLNQTNLNSIRKEEEEEDDDDEEEAQLSLWGALAALAFSTTLVAFCSEFMVSAIDDITASGAVGETFVGLILLPIVGNAAEHATAVTVAMKDKMDLSIGVAVGSSMQIALLVLPFIDILGWITKSSDSCTHDQMSLSFDGFQLAVLFVAVLLVNYLIQDGKSRKYHYLLPRKRTIYEWCILTMSFSQIGSKVSYSCLRTSLLLWRRGSTQMSAIIARQPRGGNKQPKKKTPVLILILFYFTHKVLAFFVFSGGSTSFLYLHIFGIISNNISPTIHVGFFYVFNSK